jgi:hypothetical protein
MFGLSRPVPRTIRSMPMKKVGRLGRAMLKWPLAIRMPPYQTAFCWPISRSAIQPPGSDSRYTAAV